ncbi:MAG: type II CAAX prenyl endopeptidase Rce1 family protein [Chitinophagales bacterium]
MYDSNSKGISYTAGFFILIGFVVAGLFAAALISIPVWTNMTGTSFDAMQKEMDNPAYADAAKVIQIITAFVGFFLPAVLTAFLLNKKPAKLLGFSGKIKLGETALVIAIMIAGLIVSLFLAYLTQQIPIPASWKETFNAWEDNYNGSAESIMGLNNFGEYLVTLFMLGVLPAVCEETFFRGGLQNFLTRSTKMPWVSIIIVSILFSAVHASYYGFLSRVLLGILLGIIYQYSGRIWLNILGHFINNAVAITWIYFQVLQGHSLKEAMNGETSMGWVIAGIILVPVLIFLLWWFKKTSIARHLHESVVVENNTVSPGQ